MNKTSFWHSDRAKATTIVSVLVVAFYLLWVFVVPDAWRHRLEVKLQPKPVSVAAQAGQKLLVTDCSALALPEDFEWHTAEDTCSFSAYSRPRKHIYITLNTYIDSEVRDAESDWRNRWSGLEAQLKSREMVQWGNKTADKLVEQYPQNSESMVTFLLTLRDPLPLQSGYKLKQFELRAWYTSQSDRDVVDAVVRDWQWRF
ncbi:hypothetical protein IT415_02980 [bacterium]|nr:hypothetical protein [bacterium]